MKADLKKKWVAALRSDGWKQGKHALRRQGNDGKNKFCCLGVLCEVGGVTWDDDNQARIGDQFIGNLGLSYEGLYALGLDNVNSGSLMTMNDGYEYNFGKIADWIEENIEVTP